MAVRDVMRESVTPFLLPGETVQVVFGGQARNPLTAAFAAEFGLKGTRDNHKWRIVTVTPQRILVLAASPHGGRATGVLAELPRSTRLGPPGGLLMHEIPAEGERLRVARRYFRDIKTADSLASTDD